MNTYIKRNLGGRAEFKVSHQPHHDDIRSSSTHPTSTTFAFATSICLQPHATPRNEPLPSVCSNQIKKLGTFGNADPTAPAPPLSRGMWVAQARSMQETEEDEE